MIQVVNKYIRFGFVEIREEKSVYDGNDRNYYEKALLSGFLWSECVERFIYLRISTMRKEIV